MSRGVDESVIVEVLDRFAEVGLVDDAAYARMWSSSRMRVKGNARALIRHELRRKGVGDLDIAAALDEIDDDSERERAVALVRSRLTHLSRLDGEARYRRLMGLLMRRGYSAGSAHGIIRGVLAEEAVNLDDVQITD